MSKTAKIVLWIVIVVIIVLIIALSSGGTKESGPIKVGFVAPLTGDAALYGEPGKNVIQIAVDEVNAEGGINGRNIELIIEDGKCNGKDATSAAQKLINVDKVQVILGGFCSSESLAMVPIAEKSKVAVFSYGSSAPTLTGISPYFSRVYPSDASQSEVLAKLAYNDKGWKKVAFISEQTDYARGIMDPFIKTFESLGGTVVKEEYSSDMSDFKTVLSKLKESKPDALFINPQAPAGAVRITNQIRQLKWNIPIMANEILSDPKSYPGDFSFYNGAIGAKFAESSVDTKFQGLIDKYASKYGTNPPYLNYSQVEYDSVYILRDALLAVGNNGEKISSWLRNSVKDWNGSSGLVTIRSDGDRDGGYSPFVVVDSKLVPYTK